MISIAGWEATMAWPTEFFKDLDPFGKNPAMFVLLIVVTATIVWLLIILYRKISGRSEPRKFSDWHSAVMGSAASATTLYFMIGLTLISPSAGAWLPIVIITVLANVPCLLIWPMLWRYRIALATGREFSTSIIYGAVLAALVVEYAMVAAYTSGS